VLFTLGSGVNSNYHHAAHPESECAVCFSGKMRALRPRPH
jgi:hypothetical protein